MSVLEFFHSLLHALAHAGKEALVLLPFLYLTYLGLELLERRAGERTQALIARSGKAGPLFGALLGALPQCGFSAAGAGLYAGRVITTGTLLSIFLSTSDEMLPLLISEGAGAGRIFKILAVKAFVGCLAGFAVDGIARLARRGKATEQTQAIGEMCRAGHCDCDSQSLWPASLVHTLQIALGVFGVSVVLHTLLDLLGEEALASFMGNTPLLGCLLAALVGLIPNCTASVVITTLYLRGVLSAGAMLSGLLVGAGVGLLVLFRVNRPVRDTLRVTGILLLVGAMVGVIFDALSLGALLGI